MPISTEQTEPSQPRDPQQDEDWLDLANQWEIRSDTIYLNHGSFSPPPKCVRNARRGFIDRLDANPMDFFKRELEPLHDEARSRLARFVGTTDDHLVLVDNATYAMNVVAESFPLSEGDEVLLNDHEYGAVHRIWQRRCQNRGAKSVSVTLPQQFESEQQIVDALLSGVNENTKLLIISHITSATALILPIQKICDAFSHRGIAVCVDGPHALAQCDLELDSLGCDFYTASCHKWLCATLGTGFLFAHRRWHNSMQPIMKSWGRLLPVMPQNWYEEFFWSGTRDPSALLSVPVAIDFMTDIGLENFRARSGWLASYAESALCDLFGTKPIGDRQQGWYGSMAHVPLPPGDWSALQRQLWEQAGIEIPIINFSDRWFVRVSCHLYNHTAQIDTLVENLSRLVG